MSKLLDNIRAGNHLLYTALSENVQHEEIEYVIPGIKAEYYRRDINDIKSNLFYYKTLCHENLYPFSLDEFAPILIPFLKNNYKVKVYQCSQLQDIVFTLESRYEFIGKIEGYFRIESVKH